MLNWKKHKEMMYLVFYLIIFIDFCKCMLILNLMAAQVGKGATKDCRMLQKHLFWTIHQ